MAILKGVRKTQNITFCCNICQFFIKNQWAGRAGEDYRHPKVIRILGGLLGRVVWGKYPDHTLECSTEAAEVLSVLLLNNSKVLR